MTAPTIAYGAGLIAALVFGIFGTLPLSAEAAATTTPACTRIGALTGGPSISHGEVCSVILYRTTPTITDDFGWNLNHTLAASTVIEFAPSAGQQWSATSTVASTTDVAVLAQLSLVSGELPGAIRALSDAGWNIEGIRPHPLSESPRLITVTAQAMGPVAAILNDLSTVLRNTTIPHATSSPWGTATTTSAATLTAQTAARVGLVQQCMFF